MQCKSCGFLVPQNLKFAIMKNFCPQCGEKLFTNDEMNHISMIQSRVLNQGFSDELEEEVVYDVALFVYNEITNGYGRVLLDKQLEGMVVKGDEDKPEEQKDVKVDEEEILKQIRAEEAARVQSESIVARVAGEDEDDKVKRLKELAKQHTSNKKGPSVRRIGD